MYEPNTPLKVQQSGSDVHGVSNRLQKDAMQCQKISSHKNHKAQISLEPGRGDKYIIAIFSKAGTAIIGQEYKGYRSDKFLQ